jgi:hypothetical protein
MTDEPTTITRRVQLEIALRIGELTLGARRDTAPG